MDADKFVLDDVDFGPFLMGPVEERPLQGRVPEPQSSNAALKAPISHGDAQDSTNELWELWLTASKTAYVVEQCIATTEPAYLAKHVFQLAQMFNTFYHRYPILAEPDEARKGFLLTTTAVVRRELIRALGALGIEAPAVM